MDNLKKAALIDKFEKLGFVVTQINDQTNLAMYGAQSPGVNITITEKELLPVPVATKNLVSNEKKSIILKELDTFGYDVVQITEQVNLLQQTNQINPPTSLILSLTEKVVGVLAPEVLPF